MKDLKKLNETKELKEKEMSELVNTVETEKRAFTEEELAKFEQLEKDIKLILSTVQAIEKNRDLVKEEGNVSAATEEEKRALQVADDTKVFADYIRSIVEERATDSNLTYGENGVVIPVTIADKIITRMYDISPILEKATRYKTKGKLVIPTYGAKDDGSDIVMAYANEFEDLAAKSGKFKGVELENFLAGALAKLSNSLIKNTDIDLVNKVVELIAEAGVRFLEGEALKGTTGKAKGCSTVELKIVAAAQNVITADELIKLKNKVKKTFRKNAIWIMSNDTLTAIEQLKDANGRYLFTDDLTGEYDAKILGYPVYVSDGMNEMEVGKDAIFFGDFSGLALKQAADMELQILKELYATQHATGICAWTEFDMKIEHYQKIAKLVMAN